MIFQEPGRELLFIIVAFLTAFLNIAEIVLIIRCNSRKAFDKLLLSLAASDVLVGLSIAAFKSFDLITHNTIDWLEGTSFANIFVYSITFSISNLLLITIDRFLAVRFPIKHRMLVTERQVNKTIVIVWVLCLVSTAVFFAMHFTWLEKNLAPLYIASGCLLLFGMVITMGYSAIFYMICKRKIQRAAGKEERKITVRNFAFALKGFQMAEKGVFVTGAIVSISFIICTYPFAIEFLIFNNGARISIISRLLILLNSLLNPVVYFFKRYFTSRGGRTEPIGTS